MKQKTTKRVIGVVALVLLSFFFFYQVFNAFVQEYSLFVPPARFATSPDVQEGVRVMVGGMVADDSFQTGDDGLEHKFTLTDEQGEVTVYYTGILPDMFAEQRGAAARGVVTDNRELLAEEVLVMHDENYRPDQAYQYENLDMNLDKNLADPEK